MIQYKLPVRFSGQHFTIDQILISDSIKFSKVQSNELILDIGAGKGFITMQLYKAGARVIAIENDKNLAGYLRQKFGRIPAITVMHADFRDFYIPNRNFKVVSNIPYGITADILRKLMYEHTDNYCGGTLIMQLEAAKKLVSDTIYNPYVIFYRTFFEIRIIYEVSSGCFMPPPTVRSALVAIERSGREMETSFRNHYLAFIRCLLKRPGIKVKTALKSIFRKKQIRRLELNSHTELDKEIQKLAPANWLFYFNEMIKVVPERFHPK